MKKIIAIALFLTPLISYSQVLSPEYATKVLNHRMNMKAPTNDVEKWESDTWSFSAISCYRAAKIPLPPYLNNIKLYSNGSFRSPQNLVSYCQAISEGPNLQCYNIKSTQPPFGMHLQGMSVEYIYIEKGQKINNNTPIMAGGYCYLNEKSQDKQFFAGSANFQWTQLPSPRTTITSNGQQTAMIGNGIISVPGLTKTFPVVVIQK